MLNHDGDVEPVGFNEEQFIERLLTRDHRSSPELSRSCSPGHTVRRKADGKDKHNFISGDSVLKPLTVTEMLLGFLLTFSDTAVGEGKNAAQLVWYDDMELSFLIVR